MHPDWKKFLQERAAAIEEDRVVAFGDVDAEARAATHTNIVCDLSHYGQIWASGADTAQFLQGQLTNDVREVSDTKGQLTAYCSPKGRVLSVMRLSLHRDEYVLRLPQERLQAILQRLQMYVLRADVKLEQGGTDHIRIGLAGPDIADMLAAMDFAVPNRVDDVQLSGEVSIVRVNGGNQTRFEVAGGLERLQRLWAGLSRATPVGANAWGLLDVVAGIPEIFTPTADLFVPQMINLHHLGAISLSKGCYPGQEIVARSHYLGKVKRHLVRGRGTGRQCPEPGTALSAGPTADATEVGRVLSAYTDDEGGCRLLAVAQEAAAGRPVELGWKHVHGVNLIRLESFD